MNRNFEKTIDDIRSIDSSRNYWFIRTYSGSTFEDFVDSNYVGIGFNNVPYAYLKNSETPDGYLKLREFLINNTNYSKAEVTKWSNQLINFQHEVKPGDIVIIPSENSDMLAIGEVTSDVKVVKDNRTFRFGEGYEQFPEKRRSIKWLKQMYRSDFQGDLRNMFFTRQALTSVNDYAETIEGEISSLFILDGKAHLVIHVQKDEDINAYHLGRFLNCLTYFHDEFCLENGVELNEQLYIKIKVQSKGKLALAGVSVAGLLGVSILFALSDNPEIKLDLGKYGSFEGGGDGFFQSYTKFLDAKEERKEKMILFQDSIAQIQAQRKLNQSSLDGIADNTQTERED